MDSTRDAVFRSYTSIIVLPRAGHVKIWQFALSTIIKCRVATSSLDLAEVLLLPLGDGVGVGDEYDAEIVHLIGTPPLAVPEHPEEYFVV
jgi:hypothetical protein